MVSTGAAIGIAVVALLVVGAIVAGVVYLVLRRRPGPPIQPVVPVGPPIQPVVPVGPPIQPVVPPIQPVVPPIQPIYPVTPVGPVTPVRVPSMPIRPVGPPRKGIVATWATVQHGPEQARTYATAGFDFVSLASILPQNWNGDDTSILQNVTNPKVLASGAFKKYSPPGGWLLSIGGSNASHWEYILGCATGAEHGTKKEGASCGGGGDCAEGLKCQWWAKQKTVVTGPGGSCTYGGTGHGCCIPSGAGAFCPKERSEWDAFNKKVVLSSAKKILRLCETYGFSGIDFDLEPASQFSGADGKFFQAQILDLVRTIRGIVGAKYGSNVLPGGKKFTVMYTILLGSPDTWNDLVASDSMDYLSLMLYNGGMYTAKGTGAGCDWDGWADVFLSSCGSVPCNPLGLGRGYCGTGYATSVAGLDPGKVLLGMIEDTSGKKATTQDVSKAIDLCKTRGGGGIVFWVLPGWSDPKRVSDAILNRFVPQVCADPYFSPCSKQIFF